MKSLKYVIAIFIVLFAITSCTRKYSECATIDPAPSVAYISIIDSEGNSLIGEDKVYKPSEITLTRGDQSIFLNFIEDGEITMIEVYFDQMESNMDYMLKLNSNETDILNLDITRHNGLCFDTFEIESFTVNGTLIEPDVNTYTIIK